MATLKLEFVQGKSNLTAEQLKRELGIDEIKVLLVPEDRKNKVQEHLFLVLGNITGYVSSKYNNDPKNIKEPMFSLTANCETGEEVWCLHEKPQQTLEVVASF